LSVGAHAVGNAPTASVCGSRVPVKRVHCRGTPPSRERSVEPLCCCAGGSGGSATGLCSDELRLGRYRFQIPKKLGLKT
jgi:hypothetical protein